MTARVARQGKKREDGPQLVTYSTQPRREQPRKSVQIGCLFVIKTLETSMSGIESLIGYPISGNNIISPFGITRSS